MTLHDTALLAAGALVALAAVFVPLWWMDRRKRRGGDKKGGQR